MVVATSCFAWVDLAIVGLACDVAGAVVLALSFSFKRPERIREEVPVSVSSPRPPGPGMTIIPFPQAQAESLALQRAEARLGMVLLVAGFSLQAVVYFLSPVAHLDGLGQRLIAGALIVGVGFAALVGMLTYVPVATWRTLGRMGEGIPPVARPFASVLEMRVGVQVPIDEIPPPWIVTAVRKLLR